MAGTSPAISFTQTFRGSDALERHRNALADANAHRCQRELCAALAQLKRRRACNARTRHAKRMAERDCAAIRVHVLRVLGNAEVAEHGDALGGKSFIELDDVEVGRLDAEARAELMRRRGRANTHDARLDAGNRTADEAS